MKINHSIKKIALTAIFITSACGFYSSTQAMSIYGLIKNDAILKNVAGEPVTVSTQQGNKQLAYSGKIGDITVGQYVYVVSASVGVCHQVTSIEKKTNGDIILYDKDEDAIYDITQEECLGKN